MVLYVSICRDEGALFMDAMNVETAKFILNNIAEMKNTIATINILL